jgi:hypothetical protein
MQDAMRQKEDALRKAEKHMLGLQFPSRPCRRFPGRHARSDAREGAATARAATPRAGGWVESTEPFSRTFKVTKGAALLLANIGGNIQVSPGAGIG